MDLIIGLPNTSRKHHSIVVFVDTLDKASHFIPTWTTRKASNIGEIFVEIVQLYGVSMNIFLTDTMIVELYGVSKKIFLIEIQSLFPLLEVYV